MKRLTSVSLLLFTSFLALGILGSCDIVSQQSGQGQQSGQDEDDGTGTSQKSVLDVHGAGAQRSDPKTGSSADYPEGHGPQGDVVRILNYARAVRLVSSVSVDYPVTDTKQTAFYGASAEISAPASGAAFYGQDASYSGLAPSYQDNGNGTVTDLNTGLTWQSDPGDKLSSSRAQTKLAELNQSGSLGGHTDWRLPSVKELYSLILFSGEDVSVEMDGQTSGTRIPFIDTDYFEFSYGDTSAGERIIDAQYLSSTKYVSTTMNGDETVFGVNFADGRIKGYPVYDKQSGQEKTFFVIFVRGNSNYGKNRFVNNGDGTVTDQATGLMWLQNDSQSAMNWQSALAWAENLSYAGHSDWRLPNAKELQSLVDYTRSPDTTSSAAIDAFFAATSITDEGGNNNYPFYWTSTTHKASNGSSASAVYIAFGEALGYMSLGGTGASSSSSGPTAGNGRR